MEVERSHIDIDPPRLPCFPISHSTDVGLFANFVEGKDWLWPSGLTANAWWTALGRRVVLGGLSAPEAWASLAYPEKALLTGVTAWGVRLFYRVASRSLRRGTDDPRYQEVKQKPGFWRRALFSYFLPEAVFQTFISLPFTLPFRQIGWGFLPKHIFRSLQVLAVGLFGAGFALEVLADWQVEDQKRKDSNLLCSEGVWSIVRHPNYLGDALVHASFPLYLVGSGFANPFTFLGPLANYFFLRNVSGDKENERSQEALYLQGNQFKYEQLQVYREKKNSFWPRVQEFENPWMWKIIGCGAAGIVFEESIRMYLGPEFRIQIRCTKWSS
ncbi:MAG: hypothetical protein M1819_006204 [Sarea resinae]|nr:MAG: hypothetical protein M1819_006204 [Sarea resinae]